MKIAILVISIFILASESVQSQSQNIKVNNPPVPYYGNAELTTDYVVSNSEPLGRPSGVYRNSNSTIYVSVPDTNIAAGADLVILSSADNGVTWLNISQYTSAQEVSKTKMVRSSLDSIYCFFLSGASIYRWNVLNNSFNQLFTAGAYRDFDVTASSTGSLYLFTDSLAATSVVRYGSTNGGITWGFRGLISNSAAIPRVSMSGFGDTLILNYYGPVLADTATSVIRNVRYRETAPGTMAFTGSFSNVVTSNASKTQFANVVLGLKVWVFYTSGTAGSIDLKCKVSTNSGVSYNDSFNVGSKPGRDEFWFDAKYYTAGTAGVGLIYYSDTAQAGPPTNSSDQMNFTSASYSNPSSFAPSIQFSEHPPVFSGTKDYIPTLIQYNNPNGDAGAIWVGDNSGNIKLYFDVLKFPAPLPSLNLTALIEGFYNSGSNTMVRDTVTVYLRNSTSPYSVADSSKAYVNSSGSGTYFFSKAAYGENYYLHLKQRNSIETWSSALITFAPNVSTDYNFTSLQSQAYGNNMVQVNSSPAKFALFSGDSNQDGVVDLTDLGLIDNDAFNFISGYVPTDVDGNDIVDLSDAAIADNNGYNFVVKVIP